MEVQAPNTQLERRQQQLLALKAECEQEEATLQSAEQATQANRERLQHADSIEQVRRHITATCN
eukprot:COSAG01_NODE_45128_length_412_cov_0.961661_1_plen_64_part_00